MADDHLPDEAISAVLDGEATPAEVRHAADCAPCGARLEAFRRAASLVGSPVAPVPPLERDQAIARAVATRIVPIARRRPAMGWIAAAAAVLAVVALAVPVLTSSGSRDDGDDMSATDASAKAETSLQTTTTGAGATGADTSPVDLGEFGAVDAAGLRERVGAVLTGDRPESVGLSQAGDRDAFAAAEAACQSALTDDDPAFGRLRATGRATVAGRAATVLAFGSADGQLRVFAVARDACDDILVSVTFPAP